MKLPLESNELGNGLGPNSNLAQFDMYLIKKINENGVDTTTIK